MLSLLLLLACTRGPAESDSAVSTNDSGVTDTDDGVCEPTGVLEDCATEADDDCDGLFDAVDALNCTDFFRDDDGDGAGDPNSSVCTCAAPEGYVESNDDCDDDDGARSPTATESCNGVDDDCDDDIDPVDSTGCINFYADADADGSGDPANVTCACTQPEATSDTSDDCDDTNANVNPAGTESCNGLDDDCDGSTDPDDAEGCTNFWLDSDGDGHGDVSQQVCSCALPTGYADTNEDCDDTDADVSPAATESCNSIDDDCDDAIDPTNAVGCSNLFSDRDGDTYGDSQTPACECGARDGYVTDDTDCNDLKDTINPAAEEVCNNIDDNCDNNVDGDAIDKETYYADNDGDGFAASGAATTSACSAPDGFSESSGDCDDTDAARSPGITERCDAIDNDCDNSTNDDGVITVWDGPGGAWVADVATLEDAVASASAGAEVVLCRGTYEGGLDLGFNGFDISFVGREGPEHTIIEAPENSFGIRHKVGHLTVEGLTITGGALASGRGSGIESKMSSNDTLTLTNLIIEYNLSAYGGGLYVQRGTAVIEDVILRDNEALEAGGGMMLEDGVATLTNVRLSNNESDSYGAAWISDGDYDFVGLRVDGNTADVLTSGLMIDSRAVVTATDVLMEDNVGDSGGGLLVGSDANVTFTNAIFRDNEATDFGGAVYVLDGVFTVKDSTFERNEAQFGGGAIYRTNLTGAELYYENCSFGGTGSNDNTPDDVNVMDIGQEVPDNSSADCPEKSPCTRQ